VHFGVILPNFGRDSTPDGIRRTAELAEELGFESVWATEHIIVGPDGVDPYGRVYAPLITLGWIAGFTSRVALGTSIVLAPLHHPMHLAKEVATLQEVSGGRVRLGIGMGWHKDEYDFMGVPFQGRGQRGDEVIRVMRAIWSGAKDYEGPLWSFHDATAEPLPSPQPEIWIGGSSERAVRRALEIGDVWHPSRGSDAGHVMRVKERHPDLRAIPRTRPDQVDAMLEAGAEGAVLTFADEAEMRDFARRRLA
jgi:probable F420-dependent oxidoreductase